MLFNWRGASAAIPLVTAGFYSKDDILWGAALQGETVLLWAGIIGAFMTALYTFRMIFIVFHGKKQARVQAVGGISHTLPLAVLAVLSTVVGALIIQPLAGIFPVSETIDESGKVRLEIVSAIVALLGLALAIFLYLGKRQVVKSIAKSPVGRFFTAWWYQAWGFDQLYNLIFIKPFKVIAQLLANDPVNSFMNIPAVMSRWGNKGLTFSQNGQIRWYLASMGFGAVLMLALLLLV